MSVVHVILEMMCVVVATAVLGVLEREVMMEEGVMVGIAIAATVITARIAGAAVTEAGPLGAQEPMDVACGIR